MVAARSAADKALVRSCGEVGRITMSIDNAIWFASLAAQATVIALLFYRHIWRTLPVFCAYCIWDVVGNVVVFLVGRYNSDAVYFKAYFAQAIIDTALLFCVLVEVAWSVLRPIRASLPRSALVLIGILILVAGAAIWPFTALPGLQHATSKSGLLFTQLEQTASILRILFFLLLAGGSQLLSIGWRDRELQVTTGLGLYSIVSLTVAVLATHQTTASQYAHLASNRGGDLHLLLVLLGREFRAERSRAQRIHAADAKLSACGCRRYALYTRGDERVPQ